jgi:hypothetical protein
MNVRFHLRSTDIYTYELQFSYMPVRRSLNLDAEPNDVKRDFLFHLYNFNVVLEEMLMKANGRAHRRVDAFLLSIYGTDQILQLVDNRNKTGTV